MAKEIETNERESSAKIKIKGYKKFVKKVRKMKKEIMKLNSELEKTVELKKKINLILYIDLGDEKYEIDPNQYTRHRESDRMYPTGSTAQSKRRHLDICKSDSTKKRKGAKPI